MKTFFAIAVFASVLSAGEWSTPSEVFHDDKRCVSYRARWNGEYVIVEVSVDPGWHTFAMDNKARHEAMLKGKPSLGVEKDTTIAVSGGLAVEGKWLQTNPQDFSKPELRWFTYGFEGKAYFAAKAQKTGAGPAQVHLKAQACAKEICKNIDVTMPVTLAADSVAFDAGSLQPVR
ncbi:MAG: hypothetical protein JNK48_29210 [Bryobacterales bacterium]|nr:hypothetical protein [Bryobacterales bacterium]